jgi:hypothetical protein
LSTELLAKAWVDAANDLGIEIVAPYQVIDLVTQTNVDCIAWVKSFGSLRGTVVVGRHSQSEEIRSLVTVQGMFCSFIDEISYGRYERQLFVETLNDWGWYSMSIRAPNWYTGKPWTERE